MVFSVSIDPFRARTRLSVGVFSNGSSRVKERHRCQSHRKERKRGKKGDNHSGYRENRKMMKVGVMCYCLTGRKRHHPIMT